MRLSLTLAIVLSCASRCLATNARFSEDFSAYPAASCLPEGSRLGPWTIVFTGYGCAKIESDGGDKWLHAQPAASASASETHALLVSGPSFSSPLSITGRMNTAQQLRAAGANPWEVGWILWGYTDNSHFYYFIAKTNGWELGKVDPAYPSAQRFLATGSSPSFPIGRWTTFKITQDAANTIAVYANGQLLATVRDIERPYVAGKIGLYNEDAHVHFDDIAVFATHTHRRKYLN